jgi:acyl-coenzyme A synthetase/AMP-(fatty) acid ligase
MEYLKTMRPELVDRRSNRLARAVRRLGVLEGETVAVVVCDEDEREVATTGAAKAGARVVVVPCDTPPADFADRYRREDVKGVVACADGVELWRAARVGGLILGDGEGVPWWKLAELRESAEPLLPA